MNKCLNSAKHDTASVVNAFIEIPFYELLLVATLSGGGDMLISFCFTTKTEINGTKKRSTHD